LADPALSASHDSPAALALLPIAPARRSGATATATVPGVQKSFAQEIDTSSMPPAARASVAQLGQIGYVAKGVALGLVGGPLSSDTLTADRKKQGLDGAMQTILAQPFGKFLLAAAALAFVAFGVFAMLQSRHRRM